MPDHHPSVCPACDSASVRIETAAVTAIAGRSIAPFVDEFSVCNDCGREFYTNAQSMASSRAFAAAERKAQNLLSADEIRTARLRLGITQAEFERRLGVGKKTVARWENGTVSPSRAANGLLWLALRYPHVFDEYARERLGVADSISVFGGATVIAKIHQATSPVAQPPVTKFLARPPSNGQQHTDEFMVQTQQELSQALVGAPQ
jgi:HTH-type transcriptional regulator/antitoxin MqsA